MVQMQRRASEEMFNQIAPKPENYKENVGGTCENY